jgi:hypothetical protein
MDNEKTGFFKLVPGMKPVDPAELAEYERAMREEAIPEIIEEVEMRRMLAAECRQRRIDTPTADESEPQK